MPNEDFTKKDQNEMVLINIVEELVKYTVDDIIPTMNMCTCEICKLNACAIALNNLEPHYVTTTKGGLMAKITSKVINEHIKVLVEVTKALMIVKQHPLH